MHVILIHAYYMEAVQYPMALSLQLFTGTKGWSTAVVPLFFAISGYLFLNGATKISDCFLKIKKRIRTLLVPYILWNIVFVSWFLLLSLIPSLSSFVNNDVLGKLNLDDLSRTFSFLFIEPAGFHLWFLRDLLLYVALSPLLYILLKRIPWITLLLFVAVLGYVNGVGLTYFSLGAIIGLHYSLEQVDKILTTRVFAVAFLFYLFNALLQCRAFPFYTDSFYYEQVVALAGLIVFWKSFDCLYPYVKSSINRINWLFNFTFFIYLFHEPTFNIIKKLSLKLLATSEWSVSVLYFLNVPIMVLISIFVGAVLKRYFLPIYKVLTGGR